MLSHPNFVTNGEYPKPGAPCNEWSFNVWDTPPTRNYGEETIIFDSPLAQTIRQHPIDTELDCLTRKVKIIDPGITNSGIIDINTINPGIIDPDILDETSRNIVDPKRSSFHYAARQSVYDPALDVDPKTCLTIQPYVCRCNDELEFLVQAC
jgi:hypothetical protein